MARPMSFMKALRPPMASRAAIMCSRVLSKTSFRAIASCLRQLNGVQLRNERSPTTQQPACSSGRATNPYDTDLNQHVRREYIALESAVAGAPHDGAQHDGSGAVINYPPEGADLEAELEALLEAEGE